jgi:CRP-like cAMP-binding protein
MAHPAAALAHVRILIHRLGAADRRRSATTSAGAASALAQYLVELGAATGNVSRAATRVTIPLAQHDLASLIGVSRNSLVRALGSLRSRGLIATEGRTVTIVDEPALRRYAEDASRDEATD